MLTALARSPRLPSTSTNLQSAVLPSLQEFRRQHSPLDKSHPLFFTEGQLRNMATPHSLGGKAACAKQRELRKRLLAAGELEIDLTCSDFNWKAMLKSLPTGASTVGPGVCKFTFRLLSDVVDHNYIKLDSGHRHVFEVLCASTLPQKL